MVGRLMFSTFAVLVLMSCTIVEDSISHDPSDRIRGSGDLITEVRTLPDFHSVHISTAGKVNVTYGTKQQASVTVDDNVLEYITTTVSDGRLDIGVWHGVQLSRFSLTVNLTMTDLEELSASSAGSFVGKNKFKADFVAFALSSAGDISLDIEADQVNSSLSSAGDLFLTGTANKHQAVLSSAGDLHAFNLITNTTTVIVSSAGDAEVFANDLLDVTISSVGSVYYRGYPRIRQHISSLGKLINRN